MKSWVSLLPIFGLASLMIILGFNSINLLKDLDNQQSEYDTFRIIDDTCRYFHAETILDKEYDLVKEYNMTCDSIKFIIDNWVVEYQPTQTGHSSGLFSYSEQVDYVDTGVGNVHILKHKTITQTPANDTFCAEHGYQNYTEEHTIEYLKGDFVNYYLYNCEIPKNEGDYLK